MGHGVNGIGHDADHDLPQHGGMGQHIRRITL